MIERTTTNDLDNRLKDAGLFIRGGFQPVPTDNVPVLADGSTAATVILIGNAGGDMWRAFAQRADHAVRHPLDSWLRPEIVGVAASVGATPVFPNDGPPFVPIQDWAVRAEPVYRSPIGIMIHPEFGLWHVYRAALLFRDVIELPPRAEAPSPCNSCEKNLACRSARRMPFGRSASMLRPVLAMSTVRWGQPAERAGVLPGARVPWVGITFTAPISRHFTPRRWFRR